MMIAMYPSIMKFRVFSAMQLRMSRAVTNALKGLSMVQGGGSFDHGCWVPERASSNLSRNSSRKPPACIFHWAVPVLPDFRDVRYLIGLARTL